MFGKKMEFALIFDDIINLFCEAYTCLAISIMISCFYIIVQSALCFAYSHMGKYVLYSVVAPFRDVPVLGGVIEVYIDHLISQDTQAYNAFMASSF